MVSAQNATIWGVGDDYEIDYLHGGYYTLENEDFIMFENEPAAEFNIRNVTNDQYDYTFIGYDGVSSSGSIVMTTFSAGIGSITFPNGGMPVMLPLSYKNEDEWMTSFAERLDALSEIPQEVDIFNVNSSIADDRLLLEFQFELNSTVGFTDTIFDLPSIIPPEFNGKNNTYVNTTLAGELRYSTVTGLLFGLTIDLESEDLLVEGTSMGSVNLGQQLDFVAVIPPVTLPENLNLSPIFASALLGVALVARKIRD